MILRPDYIERIMAFADTPFVKILTGVRRSGKSTIMKMIMDVMRNRKIKGVQILHYNFDSLQYDHLKTAKQLYDEISEQMVGGLRYYLFLDEIQEVESWEKAVNSMMSDYDVDIYVTGSNSRMMSSEISTYLTGRYIQFRVFPLSFKEYLSFRNKWLEKDPDALNGSVYSLDGFPALAVLKTSLKTWQMLKTWAHQSRGKPQILKSVFTCTLVKRSFFQTTAFQYGLPEFYGVAC